MTISAELFAHSALRAVIGTIIGDAWAAPYEFKPEDRLPARPTQIPPAGYATTCALQPGMWSEEGAMTLAFAASTLVSRAYDCRDVLSQFASWLKTGEFSSTGVPFDVPRQVADSVAALLDERNRYELVPGLHSFKRPIAISSDSSAMVRFAPSLFAMTPQSSMLDLLRVSTSQALLTHSTPEAIIPSTFLAALAFIEIFDVGTVGTRLYSPEVKWGLAAQAVAQWFEDDPASHAMLMQTRTECGRVLDRVLAFPVVTGSCHAPDTLQRVRMCLDEATSFEDAIERAVAFGGDTDATAGAVGAIAAIRFGLPRLKFELHSHRLLDHMVSVERKHSAQHRRRI